MGEIVVRITQAPQHGRVAIKNSRSFPNFPSSNSRSTCNTRRSPGVEAFYQPASGYTGFDSVAFEVIYPTGSDRQFSANIQVK